MNTAFAITRLTRTLCVLALLGVFTASALAQTRAPVSLRAATVTVCPVTGPAEVLPDFTASECESLPLGALNPQGRHVWAQIPVTLEAEWIASPGPKGVYVSGLAASEIYLNDVRIGANGAPGDSAATERPGRIDYAAHAPRDLFVAGENTLTLRLSAHHGALRLTQPLQGVFLAEYGSPTNRILSYYWPSLIMLGVFALGVLVFAVMAVRAEDREEPILLAGLSAALGAQLLIEALRGLVSYPYPLHDVRLIGIVASAALTALFVMALTLKRVTRLSLRQRLALLGAGGVLLLAPIALMRGFDGKTWAVLALALLLSTLVSLAAALRGRRDGWIYAAGFAGASGIAALTRSAFIDFHLFWLGGAFLILLFVEQALTLLREQRIRQSETRRAEALDAALALARQAVDPAVLQLETGGRTDFVRTQEITRIQAAGDYVELHYEDGRCGLYTLTLARIEEQLPPAFVRVHRSHIVNTAHVQTLEREPGGGGRLSLRGGGEVPVSRRILPRVRSALSDAASIAPV